MPLTVGESDVRPRSSFRADLPRHYSCLVGIALIGLPLHTGVIYVCRALGAPGLAIAIFQLWKEVVLGALLVGVGYRWATGTIRFEWRFAIPGAAWLAFAIYLGFVALLARFDAASLYGLRIYGEPMLAGLALGAALKCMGTPERLPRWLAGVACLVFVLAVLQAAFPTNAFVAKVRMSTADAFGQLPSAMTVSVVSQFRAFATFADPNDLGFFAAIVLLGTFAPVFATRRARYLRLAAQMGALLTLGVSYSRSAMLAAAVGGAAMIAVALAFDFWRYRETVVRTFVLALSLGVVLMVGWDSIAGEIPQLQHLSNTFNGSDPSAKGHVSSILQGAHLFRGHLEGFGLGRVGPRAELYSHGQGRQVHVESSYFQIGLETGIVGMALYVTALLATLLAAVAYASAAEGVEERAWGRVMVGIFVAQISGYLFLPTIVSLQTATLVWAYVGLLSGARALSSAASDAPESTEPNYLTSLG